MNLKIHWIDVDESINKYQEENLNFIKDSYDNNQKKDGLLVGGYYLKDYYPNYISNKTKALIKYIRTFNKEADDNIFRSLHNVNMATMPGWRDSDSGEKHSFIEKY